MALVIPAHVLDVALANISDVPTVRVEVGEYGNSTVEVTFTGAYEEPHGDFLDFLFALPEEFRTEVKDSVRWQDGFYGGYGKATISNATLDGTSQYDEDANTDDEEIDL